MSFSSELKSELTKIRQEKCCDFAELSAMLKFSKRSKNGNIVFSSSYMFIAECFSKLLFNCYGVKATIKEAGSKERRYYNSYINSETVRKKIFSQSETLNIKDLFKRECCLSAFLRGMFLVCGSINDPNKDYHLEFVAKTADTADLIAEVLKYNNFAPKISVRKNNIAVYIKNSDIIEEFLTKTGATQYTLQIIGIRAYKSMRNKYNRLNNCETANLTKTVNAAVDQINAIKFLEKVGKFSALPTEILNVAVLRKENPDASLSTLCSLSEEDISRSGINHRLQKLVKIANDIKNN